jgi:CRISPR-associated exonuclease Cas4
MNTYSEEDLLALSGIQHFAYCQRQWALIHVEKQWSENLRTVEGKQLHEKVDDPSFFESRGDILITRSVPISSFSLGFYGVADMVEFHAVDNGGVKLKGRDGSWHPIPIEYKRGKPKRTIIDEVQLCAQAICLEEMLKVQIEYGYIFYGETRHRTKVILGNELRAAVTDYSEQMHSIYNKRLTPKATIASKNCKACSLVDACVPKLAKKQSSVKNYIKKHLE